MITEQYLKGNWRSIQTWVLCLDVQKVFVFFFEHLKELVE